MLTTDNLVALMMSEYIYE